ncbi:MAG: aminodeoxychorismate synthase component I [Balneolaceae bacterium]|nr:MAG: aminodeoxychorismate synthase component I [Balneolaceae bacterium]
MCSRRDRSREKKWTFRDEAEFDRWTGQFLAAARGRGTAMFLDSQLAGHEASRPGYIASDPVVSVRVAAGMRAWETLRQFREKYPEWMFGWFSYDLKNEIEQLVSGHPDPVGLPDLYFFVPGILLETDRNSLEIRMIKGESFPEILPFTVLPPGAPGSYQLGALQSVDGWDRYRRNVLRIKEYITRGDTYEVNLTHPLKARFEGDSLALFASMREAGPVPFAAWLSHDGVDVCCASPERFLERKGLRVRSQPIKGTSPRGANPEEDRRIINDILKKEKNRAENVMIVDLVRHDLGQLAKTGTVRTDALLEVQTFATVHQLVSTISAELPAGTPSVDVIRSCFPMGSMTGAPKIRTMQIIEELESYRRGLYSGAIGYFTPDDNFDLNVVIRTAIIKDDTLFYPVGGAITADSEPREEWEETWLKAQALGTPSS